MQYLVFEESQVLEMGARLKQNPPIRPAHERAALWEKVVADEVDFVSSDHVAWPLSRKSNPAFSENGSGRAGAGNPVRRALHRHGDRARACAEPRGGLALRTAGAPTSASIRARGALTPGADADFAIVAPGDWDASTATGMASAVKWSPYDGMTFGARVTEHIRPRGTPVYAGGTVTGVPGIGTFIRPV